LKPRLFAGRKQERNMIAKLKQALFQMGENAGKNWNRLMLVVGVFLIVLGIFHLFVQIISPRDWESLIGWRKPILFGISTGLTLVSLSWVVSLVLPKNEKLVSAMIAVLAGAEVLLITVQTWRGVPAHFNNGALIDRMFANSIDGMLVFITLGIFYITWKSFSRVAIGADWLLAIRLGMVYLSVSCLLGFGVAIYGNLMVHGGGNPEIVNPNGVPKFVHGMPIHAIQTLPMWLLFLGFFNSDIRQRKRSLWFAALTIALTTVYAAWQTLNGFGRFEPNVLGICLLVGVGICGVIAGVFVFSGKVSAQRSA